MAAYQQVFAKIMDIALDRAEHDQAVAASVLLSNEVWTQQLSCSVHDLPGHNQGRNEVRTCFKAYPDPVHGLHASGQKHFGIDTLVKHIA